MRANDDRSINTGVRGAFGTKLLLLISFALVAFMIGAAFGAPSGTGGQQDSQSALSEVPGLGRDAAGLLRDDTIALWEHFNREQSVDRCMTAAGFEYDPVADYPAEAIVAVAASLSVQASGTVDTVMPSGRSANRTRVERMSETELDGYYTALYDETAADVAVAAANHGGVPGRDTFAEGGCAGTADAQGPRVFSIRQLVVPALASARATLEPTFDWSCQDPSLGWVSHPSELEDIDSSTTDYSAASIEACELELEKQAAVLSLQVDAVVAETLATELQAHKASYDSVPDTIRSDAAFREYLSNQLTNARLALSGLSADLDGED